MKCKECEWFSPFNDAVKRAYISSARADSVERCGLCRLHGCDFETTEDSLCRKIEFRKEGRNNYKWAVGSLIVVAIALSTVLWFSISF